MLTRRLNVPSLNCTCIYFSKHPWLWASVWLSFENIIKALYNNSKCALHYSYATVNTHPSFNCLSAWALMLSDSTPADHSSVEPKPAQHFAPLDAISALHSRTWHFTLVCKTLDYEAKCCMTMSPKSGFHPHLRGSSGCLEQAPNYK